MRTLTRASVWIALALAAALVGSCFSPIEPECAFSCDPVNDPACPDGYVCQDDGYCHRENHPEACGAFPSTKLANGQACTGDGSRCLSGFCVDGYCCNGACEGTCMACNVTGGLGTCTAVPTGQPDPDTCVGCCQADQSCSTGGC